MRERELSTIVYFDTCLGRFRSLIKKKTETIFPPIMLQIFFYLGFLLNSKSNQFTDFPLLLLFLLQITDPLNF